MFVGETIEAKLVWLFRRQPEDQSFTVPLASMDDFTVSAPPITDTQKRAIELQAGAKTICSCRTTIDDTEIGGQRWNRVTIKHVRGAARRPGQVAVPASLGAVSVDLRDRRAPISSATRRPG